MEAKPSLYRPEFCYDLVSVVMASWGNDVSVDMIVAINVHHGSCEEIASFLAAVPARSSDKTVGVARPERPYLQPRARYLPFPCSNTFFASI